MLNYYGFIATNIFLIYLITRLTGFLPRKYSLLIIVLICLISNLITINDDASIIGFIYGFINYLSITSVSFLVIAICCSFSNTKNTFPYTSLAFLILLSLFYGYLFVYSYSIYDIGFKQYTVLACIFIYAILLLLISRKFIIFNVVILIAALISLTGLLQNNIWNYLLDPILLIICFIEIIRAIFIYLVYKNIKTIAY